MTGHGKKSETRGFTLIELSIVLVIIGLVVGSILVGQDLIRAAAIRAEITQIEKYNTAANTFYGKYGYLPGDINAIAAAQFGFTARSGCRGGGDGNGIIEGGSNTNCAEAETPGLSEYEGETIMFWSDLTFANGQNINLIEGNYNQATISNLSSINVAGNLANNYFPPAAIGAGNSICVWSGTYTPLDPGGPTALDNNWSAGPNYFGIMRMPSSSISATSFVAGLGMTPAQAYSIDLKIDDGLPVTGRVIAEWPDRTGVTALRWGGPSANGYEAILGDATTCYDNGNNSASPLQYSVEVNGGNSGTLCALAIQFQ